MSNFSGATVTLHFLVVCAASPGAAAVSTSPAGTDDFDIADLAPLPDHEREGLSARMLLLHTTCFHTTCFHTTSMILVFVHILLLHLVVSMHPPYPFITAFFPSFLFTFFFFTVLVSKLVFDSNYLETFFLYNLTLLLIAHFSRCRVSFFLVSLIPPPCAIHPSVARKRHTPSGCAQHPPPEA
jgi:hypothetical protein